MLTPLAVLLISFFDKPSDFLFTLCLDEEIDIYTHTHIYILKIKAYHVIHLG